MATDLASDFAATGRVADVDRVCEVHLLDKLGKVIGVC